jgi:DNA repair exonuclease SbcCD ATPase subunit
VGENLSQTGRRRITVAEASEVLGVTVEAVRGRIKRGTLEHERDSGTVYVLLDADQSRDQTRPDDDQTSDRPRPDDHMDITEELRDRIRYLERQVEEEREARRRADTILAQLSAANAEQARTIRALEAPAETPPEERESPETAAEASDSAEHRSATAEAQEELGAERARRETAETTLQEGMAEQRRRREEAERERDELRRELVGRGRRTEDHEVAEGQQGRGQPRPATGAAQEGSRRPWWRRVLGR